MSGFGTCSKCGLEGSSFTVTANLGGFPGGVSKVVCVTCLVLVALTEVKELLGVPSMHDALDYCLAGVADAN